jgi:hypothetical protein
MIEINDPRLLIQSQEPFIILCNQNDFISTAIDWRTDLPGVHPWDHAMLSINAGKFVTQTMGIFNAYREIPMEEYMVRGTTLGFVQMVNNTPAFTSAFSKSVQKRLTAPWWVTQYDYLGVFVGQALGQPWIHTPGLEYCSVDVIRHLVNACPYLPKADQIVINAIPRETNPEGLWQIILNNPGTFSVYGYYDSALGIIA